MNVQSELKNCIWNDFVISNIILKLSKDLKKQYKSGHIKKNGIKMRNKLFPWLYTYGFKFRSFLDSVLIMPSKYPKKCGHKLKKTFM